MEADTFYRYGYINTFLCAKTDLEEDSRTKNLKSDYEEIVYEFSKYNESASFWNKEGLLSQRQTSNSCQEFRYENLTKTQESQTSSLNQASKEVVSNRKLPDFKIMISSINLVNEGSQLKENGVVGGMSAVDFDGRLRF